MSLKAILAAKGNEVVSISSTADLAAASKLLKKRQIGVLIVLGEDGRLVGILSERDIVHAMAEDGDAVRQLPVSQVMTPKVLTCDVNDVGEQWDETKLKPYPAGTFFSEPKGTPHYVWAKDGEVIVQFTAMGPTAVTPIPQKQ